MISVTRLPRGQDDWFVTKCECHCGCLNDHTKVKVESVGFTAFFCTHCWENHKPVKDGDDEGAKSRYGTDEAGR